MVLVQGTAQVEDRDSADVDVHVRPERIYVWSSADLEDEPELYDAHVDEVRSAHNQEPEVAHRAPEGGAAVVGRAPGPARSRPPDGGVAGVVGPEGFPFAVRVPVRADRETGLVRIEADPVRAPIEPGLACLCAHAPEHCFDVLGDLEEHGGGWVLRPHRVVGASHTH